MRRSEITLGEVLKSKADRTDYTTRISILIISDINLKSPGIDVFKYTLQKELNAAIDMTFCHPYELADLDSQASFDEVVLFYYDDGFEEETTGEKEMVFVRDVLSECLYFKGACLYISDSVGHASKKEAISELLTGKGIGEISFLDFHIGNRGAFNYEIYDTRKYLSADCPYNISGLSLMGEAILRYIRNRRFMYKKCLVLDCDNVLWGGVLEEVGVNGVELDTLYPGNIYLAFQKFVKRLADKGVILALCSKNDEKDVFEMLSSHPFMQIREKDIAAYRINWNNKAENIAQISKELKIDTDAFVFVDDSAEEIDIVSRSFPGITTILFDKDARYNFEELFLSKAYFDLDNNTEEDAKRNEMYYAERMRQKGRETAIDEKAYLESLELKMTKEGLNDFNIERMGQLIARTHRANLSYRKYSTEELREIGESGKKIDCYKLSDRYGDYGYIALVISGCESGQPIIHDFYMSCRALGKGVERNIVKDICAEHEMEKDSLAIDFHKTEKNSDFYRLLSDDLKLGGIEVVTNMI
jgi:FkbH-like protein